MAEKALLYKARLAKLGAPPDHIMEHFMATLYKRYLQPATAGTSKWTFKLRNIKNWHDAFFKIYLLPPIQPSVP